MKRYLPIAITIASLSMIFAGCSFNGLGQSGSADADPSATTEPVAEETEAPDSVDTKKSDEVDYEAVYADVLNVYYYMLNTGDTDSYSIVGDNGVKEYAYYSEMEGIGYTFKDLTGDGFPELIVVVDDYDGQNVISVFSAADENSVPVSLLEGWARNSYYLLEDGSFVNLGSSGFVATEFSICEFIDGELLTTEMYFTDYDALDSEDLDIYHNNSGFWDKEYSELTDLSVDDFYDKYNGLCESAVKLDVTPIASYADKAVEPKDIKIAQTPAYVSALDATNFLEYAENYKYYKVDDDEYSMEIVISADKTVKNFQFYELFYVDYDPESMQPIYTTTSVFDQKELISEEPIVIKMTFAGDLANYGYSYEDPSGEVCYYAITQSGYDGSVESDRFIPSGN